MGRKRVLRARVWYVRICARSIWSRESLAKFVASDSQDVARSIRRLSVRHLFKYRTNTLSAHFEYDLEYDRVNIRLK